MVLLTERLKALSIVLAGFSAIQGIPAAFAIKGDTACRRSVCVTASVDGDAVHYEVTANMQHLGWVALGFGPHMVHTHSVIMWKNDDGSTTLSQRYAKAFSEPQTEPNPPRVATLVEPKKTATHTASSTTFAFQIPANQSLLASSDPREQLIFALSRQRPEKDPESHLAPHSEVGYFTFDLTKDLKVDETLASAPKSQTPPPTAAYGTSANYSKLEKMIILHGFFVSFGFLVLLPAGSLIGRWGRTFTPRWFKAHWFSNFLLALPIITFGVLLGPAIVYSKQTFRIHFANYHEKFGLLLLLLYYAQAFLGRYIHNRRMELAKLGPITRPHPPLNILHIILGISIITGAFFQVRSGLEWWEALTGRGPITSWALPLWKAWIIILPIAYFSGYALLPRQFRIEREAAYAPVPVAASEARSQTTRLLAEDEEERGQ